MKRLLMTLLFVSAMVVGTMVPAAPADALGGDHEPTQTKHTKKKGGDSEVFPADETVELTCPDGFDGPDANDQCTAERSVTVPQTPTIEVTCPAGFSGPDANDMCTADTPTITPDPVPAIETSSPACLAGFTLDDSDPDAPVCTRDEITITEVTPESVITLTCPVDYFGPDANDECTRVATSSQPATVETEDICPTGTTVDSAGNCAFDIDSPTRVGVELTETPFCPTGFTLGLGGDTCAKQNTAPVEWFCPVDFVPSGPPQYTADGVVIPPDCTNASLIQTAIPRVFCDAGKGSPSQDDPPTCETAFDAPTTTEVSCPAGFSTPVNNICTQAGIRTVSVPPVTVETLVCPAGTLGPDDNGDCFDMSDETIPAEEVETITCPGTSVGPEPDGECFEFGTETVSAPAIPVPSWTCPAGFDNPDAPLLCVRDSESFDMINAISVITGSECPDGIIPDSNGDCTISISIAIDAIETITYSCPAGTTGPDANNECTRPVCKISFYDFPNGHKLLASTSSIGEVNLTGQYSHFNDDIESVIVPDGCSVSVSEHVNGGGWCYSFGAGTHNLPDDEMSWFSIPATGCDNEPADDCKKTHHWFWGKKGKC